MERLAVSPVNLYRGSHLCEFCPRPPTVLSRGSIPMLDPPPGTTGNGEIRIAGAGGIVYIAPILILHYVVAHRYRPPGVFVAAVIRQAALG